MWGKSLLNILQEELRIFPQGFYILKNVYEFFNFLLSAVWYTPIHHEQCIFIIYDSGGRERNKFQQLSKLIEVKFISTT